MRKNETMKKSKIAPIAGPLSIILGLIGIFTGIYIIGAYVGIVGLLLGLTSYADTDNKPVSYIGIVLSLAAIAWTLIFFSLWDKIP